MDRYHFHLQGAQLWRDVLGTDLKDLAQAKCHAVQYIAEYLCNKPHVFWEAETCEVRVTDARDLTLLTVSLVATRAPAIAESA